MTLADKIREARRAAGYSSQQKLADALNVSERAVKRWEAGRSLPNQQNRRDLARVLGGTADEWLGVRADPNPRPTLSDLQRQLADADAAIRELTESVNELLPLVRQALELRNGVPGLLPTQKKSA